MEKSMARQRAVVQSWSLPRQLVQLEGTVGTAWNKVAQRRCSTKETWREAYDNAYLGWVLYTDSLSLQYFKESGLCTLSLSYVLSGTSYPILVSTTVLPLYILSQSQLRNPLSQSGKRRARRLIYYSSCAGGRGGRAGHYKLNISVAESLLPRPASSWLLLAGESNCARVEAFLDHTLTSIQTRYPLELRGLFPWEISFLIDCVLSFHPVPQCTSALRNIAVVVLLFVDSQLLEFLLS